MSERPLLNGAFYLDALPIIILAIGSLFSLSQSFWQKFADEKSVKTSFFVILILALFAVFFSSSSDVHMHGSLISGDLVQFAKIIIPLIALIIAILVKDSYLYSQFYRGEITALFLMVVMGMLVLISSYDLITIFIGLELTSIGFYALIGYTNPKRTSQEAALKYFILGSLASSLLLFGFGFLYASTGHLDLENIVLNLAQTQYYHWAKVGGIFVIIALGFKLALAPFHLWAADAYEGAPTAITAFMATAGKIILLLFFMRLSTMGFQMMADQWIPAMTTMAALSMIAGNILALVQTSLKRTLAYSSIAHGGYIGIAVCVIGSKHPLTYQAILFYLISYTITSLLAFAVIMLLETEKKDNIQLDDIAGLVREHPWLSIALAVAMFSFAGMPPTIGFLAKLFLFNAAIAGELYALVIIGVIGSSISLYFYLRIIVKMFMQSPTDDKESFNPSSSLIYRSVIGVGILATILIGTIAPQAVLQFIKPVVSELSMKP